MARAAWWIAAAIAAGIFIASLPAYVLNLGKGPPAVVASVEASARFVFAVDLLNALASIAAALVSFSLAGVLFRRKPNDRARQNPLAAHPDGRRHQCRAGLRPPGRSPAGQSQALPPGRLGTGCVMLTTWVRQQDPRFARSVDLDSEPE